MKNTNTKTNCASLALKVGEAVIVDYSKCMEKGLNREIYDEAKSLGRKVRPIADENSRLSSNEWMILFIGFYETKDPFIGIRIQDFHFVLRNEDGSWVQQDSGGKPESADIYALLASAKANNISHQFFAVSEI